MNMRSFVAPGLLAAGVFLALTGPGMAAGYLKIGDIKGESQRAPTATDNGEILAWSWGQTNARSDSDHKDWINLLSVNSSASAAAAGPSVDGPGTLVIRRRVDKSSPKLMEACANGKHIDKVDLTLRKAGGESETYYKYELENVIITSYSVSGAGQADDRPTEEVAFYYNKVARASADRATPAGMAVKPMRAAPAQDYNSSRSNN